MRRTPPCEAVGPICGMERKNLPVLGSHTGCSAPFVASTPWAASNSMFFTTARAPVALLTWIKVPNGGSDALLITRSNPSFGSYASSSARVFSPAFVKTSLTVVGGLVRRSKVSTRLGASVTKSQGNAATTPLGPAQSLAPAAGEQGTNPANAPWPLFGKIWPTNVSVLALTTSTALLDRKSVV